MSGFHPQSRREGWEEARGDPWGAVSGKHLQTMWPETAPGANEPSGTIGNTFLQNALREKKKA